MARDGITGGSADSSALTRIVSPKAGLLRGAGVRGDFILVAIYLNVTAILLWLVCISRGLIERAYFALCATSATSGLVRTVFGD